MPRRYRHSGVTCLSPGQRGTVGDGSRFYGAGTLQQTPLDLPPILYVRLTRFCTFLKMRALTIQYTAFWAAEYNARIEKAKFSKFLSAYPVQSFKQFSKLVNFGKFLQNNNEKHETGRQKQTSIHPCHFVPNQNLQSRFICSYYMRNVKNVVLRRAQMQRSCSIADRAHWMEYGKMKGMIICNIFIHRICDIIRRSMVIAYYHFQHFEYLLFFIIHFFCITSRDSTY